MFTPFKKNIEDREYLILHILLTYLYLKPDVNCSYYRFDFFPQPVVYSSADHKSNFQTKGNGRFGISSGQSKGPVFLVH